MPQIKYWNSTTAAATLVLVKSIPVSRCKQLLRHHHGHHLRRLNRRHQAPAPRRRCRWSAAWPWTRQPTRPRPPRAGSSSPLLHVPEELGHEDRGPRGEYALVRGERLAGHDERDVRPLSGSGRVRRSDGADRRVALVWALPSPAGPGWRPPAVLWAQWRCIARCTFGSPLFTMRIGYDESWGFMNLFETLFSSVGPSFPLGSTRRQRQVRVALTLRGWVWASPRNTSFRATPRPC